MSADLHLHSRFSDGTDTPEELVARAVREQLSVLALTDHDTVEGCGLAAAAAARAGLECITASELTAEIAGHELHLLAYFIDPLHAPLLAALARFQQARQDRIREMVARINRLGVPLQEEAVFALAGCRSPGRPHVGRALVQAGFCRSVDEAFDRFLRRDRPAWAPKYRIGVEDAIRLVHEAGGLAVLAHPGLNRVDPFLPTLAEAGLDGLECFHSRHAPSTAEHYLAIARERGLLVTGGSDCHGLAKGTPLMGTVRLPLAYLEPLRRAAARRRAATAIPAA